MVDKLIKRHKICMLLDNPLNPDPRVQKEAKYLADVGYDVTIYCQQSDDLPELESQGGYIIRRTFKYKLGTTIKIIKYLQAQYQLWRSITGKYDIYHCHDVETWSIGYYLAKRDKALLVYDSHEYFPDMIVQENYKSKFKYYISRFLFFWRGALFISKADRVITVSKVIADQLQKEFHLRHQPVVLYNTRYQKDIPQTSNYLREKLNIQDKDTILFFHGNIDPSRGIERLIEILANLENCKLIIAGSGADNYITKLKSLTQSYGLEEMVMFIGFIPNHDLLKVVASADILLYFPVEVVKNVTLSMPNKFFDFLFAGKPMVVTGLPEIESLMNEKKLGIVIPRDRLKTDVIVSRINELIDDKIKYQGLVDNYKLVRQTYCWENEAVKLVALYEELIKNRQT